MHLKWWIIFDQYVKLFSTYQGKFNIEQKTVGRTPTYHNTLIFSCFGISSHVHTGQTDSYQWTWEDPKDAPALRTWWPAQMSAPHRCRLHPPRPRPGTGSRALESPAPVWVMRRHEVKAQPNSPPHCTQINAGVGATADRRMSSG